MSIRTYDLYVIRSLKHIFLQHLLLILNHMLGIHGKSDVAPTTEQLKEMIYFKKYV